VQSELLREGSGKRRHHRGGEDVHGDQQRRNPGCVAEGQHPDDERIADPLLAVGRIVQPYPVRRPDAREGVEGQTIKRQAVVASDIRNHRQSCRHLRRVDVLTPCDHEEGNVAVAGVE